MPERGGTVAGFTGWAAADLAEAAGVPVAQALRLLEGAVARGEVARLECGATTLYARLAGGSIPLVSPPQTPGETPETERTDPMPATNTLDAWTPRALAECLRVDQTLAEETLDAMVASGDFVKLEQGEFTLYVGAGLADLLVGIGAVPVEGDRLAARRRRVQATPNGRKLRELGARLRADELAKAGAR